MPILILSVTAFNWRYTYMKGKNNLVSKIMDTMANCCNYYYKLHWYSLVQHSRP